MIKPYVSPEMRAACAGLVRQLREEVNAIEEANRPKAATLPAVDRNAWEARRRAHEARWPLVR